MKYRSARDLTLPMTIITATLLSGCGGGDDGGGTTPDPVTSPTAKCAGATLDSGASCVTLGSRDAIVYKPAGEIKGIALFLHGAPGTPKKVSNIFNAKSITADKQLLSVSPQGSNDFWGWESLNDGESKSTKDVDFMVKLLTQLKADNNISSDKVYVFGYSAGGFMAYKLACHIPEQITAIVSLAGQFRGDFTHCTTSTPVTLHHFHSPADTDVPMSGRNTGNIQSVAETLAHWRNISGCDAASYTVSHPGVISASTGTETQTWQNCTQDISFSKMDKVPHESSYDDAILRQIYSPIFD
ncbi:MAG: polyhydroxybutyrate depolymerase [Shewanella sp.]|jgi:polyhydroxybutyrate depolymerase